MDLIKSEIKLGHKRPWDSVRVSTTKRASREGPKPMKQGYSTLKSKGETSEPSSLWAHIYISMRTYTHAYDSYQPDSYDRQLQLGSGSPESNVG